MIFLLYDNLKNINENFYDLMEMETQPTQNEEMDQSLKSLKQNIEFLNDLLNGYNKEP